VTLSLLILNIPRVVSYKIFLAYTTWLLGSYAIMMFYVSNWRANLLINHIQEPLDTEEGLVQDPRYSSFNAIDNTFYPIVDKYCVEPEVSSTHLLCKALEQGNLELLQSQAKEDKIESYLDILTRMTVERGAVRLGSTDYESARLTLAPKFDAEDFTYILPHDGHFHLNGAAHPKGDLRHSHFFGAIQWLHDAGVIYQASKTGPIVRKYSKEC